jgi:hypothetical protein
MEHIKFVILRHRSHEEEKFIQLFEMYHQVCLVTLCCSLLIVWSCISVNKYPNSRFRMPICNALLAISRDESKS